MAFLALKMLFTAFWCSWEAVCADAVVGDAGVFCGSCCLVGAYMRALRRASAVPLCDGKWPDGMPAVSAFRRWCVASVDVIVSMREVRVSVT